MDTQLNDIVGNPIAIGDKVVVDITAYKSTRLQVGTVIATESGCVTVQYEKTQRWGSKKTRLLSVCRQPQYVVKVAA